MSLIKRLWNDEAGFVVSAELILIATITVLGLIVGLTAVRDAVTSELSDVAGAVQDVDQSYVWLGIRGHSGSVAGSDFTDFLDFCDSVNDPNGSDDNCITHVPAISENSTPQAPTGN
ncbi:hypothetical protein GC197_01340 [bacterium]|nr:hypothetical protein [bacterium]